MVDWPSAIFLVMYMLSLGFLVNGLDWMQKKTQIHSVLLILILLGFCWLLIVNVFIGFCIATILTIIQRMEERKNGNQKDVQVRSGTYC